MKQMINKCHHKHGVIIIRRGRHSFSHFQLTLTIYFSFSKLRSVSNYTEKELKENL
jgi:hypothetical protein